MCNTDAPDTTPEIGGDDSPGGHHEYAPIGEPGAGDIYIEHVPEYTPSIDAPGTPCDDDGSSGNW